MNYQTWGVIIAVPAAALSIGLGMGLSSHTLSESLPDEIEALYSEMLQQSQTKASNGSLEGLKQAVQEVSGIPQNSRHFATAHGLQERWTKDLLQIAQDKYRQAAVNEALETLQVIPPSSSIFPQVQSLKADWGQQATQVNHIFQLAQQEEWSEVIQGIEALQGGELYRSPRVQELLQSAIVQEFQLGVAPTARSPQSQLAQLPVPVLPPLAPATAIALPPPPPAIAVPVPSVPPVAIATESALQAASPRNLPTVVPPKLVASQVENSPSQPSAISESVAARPDSSRARTPLPNLTLPQVPASAQTVPSLDAVGIASSLPSLAPLTPLPTEQVTQEQFPNPVVALAPLPIEQDAVQPHLPTTSQFSPLTDFPQLAALDQPNLHRSPEPIL